MEVSNVYFLRLLHAMLRDDNSEADPERSRNVVAFMAERGTALGKVLTFDQRRLAALVLEYFRTHQNAPSLKVLSDLVFAADKSEAMMALLTEYNEYVADFEVWTSLDAGHLLDQVTEAWMAAAFAHALRKAQTIVASGVTGDVRAGEKESLRGLSDARMYLLKELQSPAFSMGAGNVGGSMAETADQLISIYDSNKRAARDNALVIPTGVKHIDDTLRGFSRGSVNLILGYAGQRKSALARTFAYNAAASGFRVLFIPLEISFKDELGAFGIMHAYNTTFIRGAEGLSVDRFRNGQLLPYEEEALRSILVPDIKQNIGTKLVIKQLADTTWENIRAVIELENFIEPLDMVVIDYLGLLDTKHHRDKVLAINEAAIQMKQMALTFPNGKGGLVFVTPAQGSRKGYEEATTNQGVWDKSGIYMYSELEKSADTIVYASLTPDLQTQGVVMVGTCKSRNSADAPGQLVPIIVECGLVGRKVKEHTEAVVSARPVKDTGLAELLQTFHTQTTT